MVGQPAVPVPSECLPLMVTFANIADPKSVSQVDPGALAASFGPGVRLKAVTLEVTEEPVTEGKVDNLLSWLAGIGGGMLDGTKISSISATNRLANDLTRWDIVRP